MQKPVDILREKGRKQNLVLSLSAGKGVELKFVTNDDGSETVMMLANNETFTSVLLTKRDLERLSSIAENIAWYMDRLQDEYLKPEEITVEMPTEGEPAQRSNAASIEAAVLSVLNKHLRPGGVLFNTDLNLTPDPDSHLSKSELAEQKARRNEERDE